MNSSLRTCKSYHNYYHHSPFHSNHSKLLQYNRRSSSSSSIQFHRPKCTNKNSFVAYVKRNAVRASSIDDGEEENMNINERRSFLSFEEAGLVEISGLNAHERFLCRLTISSLNLLKVVAEQEGCTIEELNAGRVCDWFLKDKLKREQDIGSAVLQWDDDDPFDLQF